MRFAVFGSGGWAGSRHVEALRLLGQDVVALVDPFPGCAEQAAAIGAKALKSFDELDLDTIDATTLALPPDLHPIITEKLARAGKHVLCEKPMAPDSASARKLADFASTVNVRIMPGYLLRTNPHIRAFKEQLDKMGTLRRVHLSTNVLKPSMSGWRSEKGIGGALLVNAIHQLDMAMWFAGEAMQPRIGILDNVHHKAPTEDYFYVSMESASGCASSVLSSWSLHPPQSRDGLMLTREGRLRIETESDGGSMVLTGDGFRVNDKDVIIEGVVGVNQFEKELAHFIDAIENGTPLWVTPEDNYLVQKLIEDCRAISIRSSRNAVLAA